MDGRATTIRATADEQQQQHRLKPRAPGSPKGGHSHVRTGFTRSFCSFGLPAGSQWSTTSRVVPCQLCPLAMSRPWALVLCVSTYWPPLPPCHCRLSSELVLPCMTSAARVAPVRSSLLSPPLALSGVPFDALMPFAFPATRAAPARLLGERSRYEQVSYCCLAVPPPSGKRGPVSGLSTAEEPEPVSAMAFLPDATLGQQQ